MMTINNHRIAVFSDQANNRTGNRLGLYIHLPFCQRKCGYCGFLSMEAQPETVRRQYLDNLLREIAMRREWLDDITLGQPNQQENESFVDSIFIGGGTPSLLDGGEINRLLDGIRACWRLNDQAEITMEANPNSLSLKNLSGYLSAGVNRLSIGIQSFDDCILSELGRLHDAECGKASVAMAKQSGFENVNIDLMFGLPGQTMIQWIDSLHQAISLNPSHLSLYTLQLEEGTKFYQDYKVGKLPLVDAVMDRKCYHYAIDLLHQCGYDRYEISNFAKPGYECRHNLKYWSMGYFFGFGLAASSYFQGIRWSNQQNLGQWTDAVNANILPVDKTTVKKDSCQDEMGIFMFTGLRKASGISLLEFEKRFGVGFFQVFSERMERLEGYRRDGLLDWTDSGLGNLWLTDAGVDVSNQIMAEFV